MIYYYASPLWFTAMIPLAVLYSVTCNVLWRPPMMPPLPAASTAKGFAIVTGANTGIGFEAARALAGNYYEVILACRSLEKGQAAVDAIVKEFPQAQVRAMPLDLTSRVSIRSFAQSFPKNSIAILINNAGRNTDPPSTTERNVLFQTNFVGHFDLIRQLLHAFHPQARLVQVSSVMHHFAPYEEHWTESQFWKQVAGSSLVRDRYSLSKLAAILFSVQLNRLYGHHLQSIAVNPGAV
jgi:NAD(P)-dependent dehydrogenase (short-subunit alcohol dehydrogenase family)